MTFIITESSSLSHTASLYRNYKQNEAGSVKPNVRTETTQAYDYSIEKGNGLTTAAALFY